MAKIGRGVKLLLDIDRVIEIGQGEAILHAA
jgi:hypothetical protein